MIVTVTPNPSVDLTLELDHLVLGEVHRAHTVTEDPGGKGVNVARALVRNGFPAQAIVPVGGIAGVQLTELLAAEGVEALTVHHAGGVRTNVTIVTPGGVVTKINAPGASLSSSTVDALLDAAATHAARAAWVVGSGSLPPDASVDFYSRLARRVAGAGALVAVDSSGWALLAALPAGPDLVKPNLDELEEAVGTPLRTLGDVVSAAQGLRRMGATAVLASLGADGAVLVDDEGEVWGEAPPAEPRSTVGAGDVMLAGFLAARATGADGPRALAEALAWGSAACSLPGSQIPTPAEVDRWRGVTVHTRFNHDQPIRLRATVPQEAR